MTLVLLMVFTSVMLLGLSAYALTEKTPALARLLRLHDVASIEVTRDPEALDERERVQQRVAALVSQFAGPAGHRGRRGAYATVDQRLIQAGFRRSSALTVYMGSRVLLSLGLATAVLLYPGSWQLADAQLFVALGGAAGLGFVLPGLFVDQRRKRRQRLLQKALPDAIDLMVVCLEAGLSLSSALMRVASEFVLVSPLLASEFRLVVLETRAGKSHVDALRALADRTGLPEIRAFVSTLIQTERFGTDLADTFRVHSESLRNRRLLIAEETAQKAPVKMLFPAALFIFPATLIVTIGPGVLQIIAVFQ